MGQLAVVTRLVCSEVCWFICGQLGVILAGRHSLVLVLADMAGQVRRRGGWRDLPLATGGLLYLGCAAGSFVSD